MTRIQGDQDNNTCLFFLTMSQCFQRIPLDNFLVFDFTSAEKHTLRCRQKAGALHAKGVTVLSYLA
jgi:hypothetical protein